MSLVVTEETPRGHGAVSVVRVRGEGASERLRRALGWSTLELGVPKVGRLSFDTANRGLSGTGLPASNTESQVLDEALVCARSRDDVELHVHGSPVLVRALIAALEREFGASPRRHATCAAARARLLLEGAQSESGARILLDQVEGAWSTALDRVARGAFSDAEFAEWVERSRVARHALEPARIVLAGAVNAGKSTLFNVLVGEGRAITSDEPGTTRDLVRTRAMLGAYPVELVDTAGEREHDVAADEIEAAGIGRARAARESADLVVWLVDAASARERDELAPPSEAERGSPPIVRLWSRADRVAGSVGDELATSALRSPDEARALVARLHRETFGLPLEPWTRGAPAAFDAPSREILARLASAPSAAARSALAADAWTHESGPSGP